MFLKNFINQFSNKKMLEIQHSGLTFSAQCEHHGHLEKNKNKTLTSYYFV